MRRISTILILCLCAMPGTRAWAAGSMTAAAGASTGGSGQATSIANSATLPATCSVGEIYMDTDATSGQRLYLCESTNAWVLQGDGSPATPTMQQVFAAGKEITGANSLANAYRIGDGTTPWCIYTDATAGPQIRPCTDAHVKTTIPTNFTWALYDEEGAAAVETVDPDAASVKAVYTYGTAYQPKKTAYWDAGAINVDGTNCAAPTEQALNSAEKTWAFSCADSNSSIFSGKVRMPAAWDGGTVTFTLSLFHGTSETITFAGDFSAQCRGAGDAINSTYGTVQAADVSITTANQIAEATTAALTPNGTCAGNKFLLWRYVVDAANFSANAANSKVLGVSMVYSITSRSD